MPFLTCSFDATTVPSASRTNFSSLLAELPTFEPHAPIEVLEAVKQDAKSVPYHATFGSMWRLVHYRKGANFS